jgi:DNA-binding response OmpR family regulator
MREAGHEVLVAITMREAFLRISEGGIDAVVVDSYDPRVGVVELARTMTALPDAPPLVLVSPSPHAPEISARIGATAFLPKPCEPSEGRDRRSPHQRRASGAHVRGRRSDRTRAPNRVSPGTSVDESS